MATSRGRVTLPVNPSRSTGHPKPKPKVWRAGPEKKSLGAETTAVRAKYRDVLNTRKAMANKKGGEAGKAELISWKRASGYQADWNAAKAKDTARPPVAPGARIEPPASAAAATSTRGADHDARVAALKAQTYKPKPKPKGKK